ncbi:hypothetical protein MMC34_000241 [Xylographa carneopallida]|nr:hypothetical protein [Xylographa carneopallida]
MANRQLPVSAPRNLRDTGARTSPGPLQTRNLNANPRFSYTETPIQAHSEVFAQPPVFQQFSSPTNSTIDESPITPFTQQPAPYISENQRQSPFPQEKAFPARTDSPYNAVAIDEVHPAHFAPYAEASPAQPHLTSTPYQLSAIPPRSQSSEPSRTRGNSDLKTAQSVPFLNTTDKDRKQDLHQSQFAPKTPTYNPNSVSGPNGALENHRPGQVSHPNAAIQPEWKHGLCELDSLCCTGLFCPCMVYGKTQYRLAQKSQRREATDLLGYESFNGSCGLMAAACGFQCKRRTAGCYEWLDVLMVYRGSRIDTAY